MPVKEARKQSIAAALINRNPALTVFQFRFAELAASYGISIDEAKIRFRHLELNGPDVGNGIQITLLDDGARLTVPYWHKDDKARVVFSEIWVYLTVIRTTAGYEIHDPQLDRIIDLDSDLKDVVNCYSGVIKAIW